MTVYTALNNDTAVVRQVEIVTDSAGRIRCLECGGSGKWPWEPDGAARRCPDCKGTGRVFVSI